MLYNGLGRVKEFFAGIDWFYAPLVGTLLVVGYWLLASLVDRARNLKAFATAGRAPTSVCGADLTGSRLRPPPAVLRPGELVFAFRERAELSVDGAFVDVLRDKDAVKLAVGNVVFLGRECDIDAARLSAALVNDVVECRVFGAKNVCILSIT